MSKHRLILASVGLVVFIAAAWYLWQRFAPPAPWSDDELARIDSLSLARLPSLPADPTNAVADDERAARFGHRLFFDPRLSANGAIACATCHQPIRRFTDGLPTAVAIGRSPRNTPSIVGAAFSPWLYWDGRKDSLWSQALSPLEDPNEHGSHREQIAGVIAADPDYRVRYESLFGGPPQVNTPAGIDRTFVNVGKVIAAYERKLLPGPSRFDRYASHLASGGEPLEQAYLSATEIRGLRLFIGKARCTECHNGPLLTNNEFHNTGLLSVPGDVPDRGRVDGVRDVLGDPFNCAGSFSDSAHAECAELRYVRTGSELIGATRTPSLRNLENTAPYQSKGQFATLDLVLRHYNDAPPAMIGHNEAEPLGLARWQLDAIEAFLNTLAAPIAADPGWLAPPPDAVSR